MKVEMEPLNYYLNSEGSTYNGYPGDYGYETIGTEQLTPDVTISTITYNVPISISKPPLEMVNHTGTFNIKEEIGTIKIKEEIETVESTNNSTIREKKSKSQTCNVCNRTLASASSYYVHMKQHSSDKPYCCSRCDASFCRKPYLEVHMRVHTGEKPFKCETCHKRFTQKSSLNTHRRCHTGIKPYICETCKKSFTVKSYLTAHQWTHISRVFCNECDLTFNSKHAYLEHMQNHKDNKFACEQCYRVFVKESYLIRHVNKIHRIQSETF